MLWGFFCYSRFVHLKLMFSIYAILIFSYTLSSPILYNPASPTIQIFFPPVSSRVLLCMPAYMASRGLLCTKVLCAYDTVPGSAVVMLLDPESGHTKAVSVISPLHKHSSDTITLI